MKKLLFLVAAVLVCATAGAQLVTSSSYKEKKSESKTFWMLRAGMTSVGVSGDDTDELTSLAGYNVSFEFNRSFATDFYWGAGLVFGNKGYKVKDYDARFTTAKLEVPLNFGYKYALTEEVRLDGHIGAFINYDLFGTSEDKEDDYSVDLSDMEDYDRLGYGLQFGVGVWYQKFNFNITYQKGLAKQYDEAKIFENNWMFSVGYAF